MLLGKLDDKGITGLSYWDNGFKIMSANSPLKTTDDFLGLKMRIQSSKVIEAYQALQTGVVDGTENPPSNMYTQKMNEVQKHATISNHGYLGYAVIVNKTFWDGLPAEVRAGLDKAMIEATDYANTIAKAENDAALKAMQDAGTTEFYTLSNEERAQWADAVLPMYDTMSERIGAQTIQAVKDAIGM